MLEAFSDIDICSLLRDLDLKSHQPSIKTSALPSFQYTSTTTTTTTMDVWTCCQCRSSNHIANSPERCPICGHFRDSYCRIGRRVAAGPSRGPNPQSYRTMAPPLSPRPATLSSKTPVARNAISGYHEVSRPLGYPSVHSAATGQHPPPQAGGTSNRHHARTPMMEAPSMAGWWFCHCCNHLNNPRLCAGRCTICGHDKCGTCAPALGRR